MPGGMKPSSRPGAARSRENANGQASSGLVPGSARYRCPAFIAASGRTGTPSCAQIARAARLAS